MSNPHFKQTIDGLNAMHEVGQVTEAMSLGAIQAQATLALAYEQRTANLIALWSNPEITLWDVKTGRQRTTNIGLEVMDQLRAEIFERLEL